MERFAVKLFIVPNYKRKKKPERILNITGPHIHKTHLFSCGKPVFLVGIYQGLSHWRKAVLHKLDVQF